MRFPLVAANAVPVALVPVRTEADYACANFVHVAVEEMAVDVLATFIACISVTPEPCKKVFIVLLRWLDLLSLTYFNVIDAFFWSLVCAIING